MVDGKAVHRTSVHENGSKGKRLSSMAVTFKPQESTIEADAAEMEEDEEGSVPGSPVPVDLRNRRASHLVSQQQQLARSESYGSSPSLHYSEVYGTKSTKSFNAGRPGEGNEGSARDEEAASVVTAEGSPVPIIAVPGSSGAKPTPPPVPPASALAGLSLAANVPGAYAPSSSKAGTPPPPPPPVGAAASAAAIAAVTAAAAQTVNTTVAPPPPPTTTTAVATVGPGPSRPPPPPIVATHTPPLPQSSTEEASKPAVPSPAPLLSSSNDTDSDEEEESPEAGSGRPSSVYSQVPIPVPTAIPARPNYLEQIQSGGAALDLSSIKLAGVRPPPPPPPPPSAASLPGTPAGGKDTAGTPAKVLLKPKPPADDSCGTPSAGRSGHMGGLSSNQPRARLSIGGAGARTASTDSVSGQLSHFHQMMGGGIPDRALAGREGAEEQEELDPYAAVHDEASVAPPRVRIPLYINIAYFCITVIV